MSNTTLQESDSESQRSYTSSSLSSDLRGSEASSYSEDEIREPLDDILNILARKREKSKAVRKRMDRMYDRVKDVDRASDRIESISKHIEQVDGIVDNATYMKIEKNKRLLIDKTNWQNDEDQVNVMQSLHKSQMLVSQLESELQMCNQPMDLSDPNTVGSKLLSQHKRDAKTGDFVPTRFLVFDKSGRCLGNVDPPICMELNSTAPVAVSAGSNTLSKPTAPEQPNLTEEENRSRGSRTSSMKASRRKSSSASKTPVTHEQSSGSLDLGELPDSSEEDLKLVQAIGRLVQRVEKTAATQSRESYRYSDTSRSNDADSNRRSEVRDSRLSKTESVRSRRQALQSPRKTIEGTGPEHLSRTWRERVPELKLAEFEDSTDDEGKDVEYPGVSALAITALGKSAYGDSQWSVLEKKIRAMTHDAAMEHHISAGYVDNFTWDDDAPKMGAQNLPTISEVLTNTGIGGKRLIRASAWKTADSEPSRLSGGGGGLLRPRANKFLTTGELAYYHSQMSDEDQMNLVSVLLACRKLEKTLEDQNTVIDLLQKDLEQVRKTTFQLPDGLRADQFVNLLDLDGPICGDYFQLPECTAAFYSRLYADPTSQLARGAAVDTEKKLRDALKQNVGRNIHSPQIIHRMVEDVLSGNKDGKKAVWQVGKAAQPDGAATDKAKAAPSQPKGSIKASDDAKKLNLRPGAADTAKAGPGAVKPGVAGPPKSGPGATDAKKATGSKPAPGKSDAKPGAAGDSKKPGATGDPKKPGATGDPKKPGATGDPKKPGATGDPKKPAAATDPKKPAAAATDPKKPAAAADPKKPAAAADPKKPAAAADPKKPAAAADPKKPASSDPKATGAKPGAADVKKADGKAPAVDPKKTLSPADAKKPGAVDPKKSDAKNSEPKKTEAGDAKKTEVTGNQAKKAEAADAKKTDAKKTAPGEVKKTEIKKADAKDPKAAAETPSKTAAPADAKKTADAKKEGAKKVTTADPKKTDAEAKKATDPKKAEAKKDETIKKPEGDASKKPEPKKADSAKKTEALDPKKADPKKTDVSKKADANASKKVEAKKSEPVKKADVKLAEAKKVEAKKVESKKAPGDAKTSEPPKKADAKKGETKASPAAKPDPKKTTDLKNPEGEAKKPAADGAKAKPPAADAAKKPAASPAKPDAKKTEAAAKPPSGKADASTPDAKKATSPDAKKDAKAGDAQKAPSTPPAKAGAKDAKEPVKDTKSAPAEKKAPLKTVKKAEGKAAAAPVKKIVAAPVKKPA